MLKEKLIDVKDFIKINKGKVILGTVVVVSGVALVICKKDIKEVKDIAIESLERELDRINFEKVELTESIARLKQDAPINKFDRIPRREARIAELDRDAREIISKLIKVKSK